MASLSLLYNPTGDYGEKYFHVTMECTDWHKLTTKVHKYQEKRTKNRKPNYDSYLV